MIEARQITKSFGEPAVEILHGLSITINQGEFVSITGRSGSGKSTLLYIISSLDSPTSGELLLDGKSLGAMSEDDLHRFRNEQMGFIFQFHYLLPELTALENVLMPARKTGRELELRSRALELLSAIGLESKAHRRPGQLSGGEQQRIAIARALIMRPRYLFADEPTGSLDSINGGLVMDILEDVAARKETAVVYVTHDREFAERATRRIHLVDGRVVQADP
jgi:putative ABC transport system ATP-binding protein/lipoprotein-releasing system ATP-binding protein